MACGALILTLAMGVRHTGGLFLQPMTLDQGWSRELFSFSIALQNLLWGLFQPFAGAFADRHGAGRTLVGGALLYIVGLVVMAHADTALGLNVGAGLLIGMGLSGTTFSVVLGVIGRMAAPEKRSMALGLASAGGSFGQFAVLPVGQGLAHFARIDLDDSQAQRFNLGQRLRNPDWAAGLNAVFDPSGRAIGLGQVDAEGLLAPQRRFNG